MVFCIADLHCLLFTVFKIREKQIQFIRNIFVTKTSAVYRIYVIICDDKSEAWNKNGIEQDDPLRDDFYFYRNLYILNMLNVLNLVLPLRNGKTVPNY